MSTESTLRSPQTVADELNISSATLRRWSDEFTDHLSNIAGTSKDRSHRRYTDGDVATLVVIKDLMSSGMTYEYVRQQLNGGPIFSSDSEILQPPSNASVDQVPAPEIEKIERPDEADDNNEEWALVASNETGSQAIAFLTNTLSTLSDSQKSILNSQSANRELLGVLLQDNFNLKEENTRLRERILDVERDVSQNRQEEEWRREALRQELEAKITSASQLAAEAISTARAVEAPEIKAIENKPGCLGMLFGGGGTQIITVPKRRKADKPGQGQPSAPLPNPPVQPQAGQPQPAAQKYPKPMFPPE